MAKSKPSNPDREWLKEVGQRIKSARSTNGITQETLAEQSQLAPRTIQKIEAGEITILISTLRRIRTALDCDFNDLLPE